MQRSNITRAHASLEMALWQVEADTVTSSDLYARLRSVGLAPEIAIRLKELAAVTKKIGDKLVSLGKIILIKLMNFIEQHPNLAAGLALGAALSLLTASIPILGPILAPLVAVVGITVFAVAGHHLDKNDGQQTLQIPEAVELAQDAVEIARIFFQLFIDTIQAIAGELSGQRA